MTLFEIIQGLQYFFLFYFVAINGVYLMLDGVALISIYRYMQRQALEQLPLLYANYEPPISILVPAYNEESSIPTSIRSLLQIHYSDYEIIVINDGSKDHTVDVLIHEFSLVPFPEDNPHRLEIKPVRGVYRSTVYPNLRVIDKENGGKADALNAGINYSHFDLCCAVDADSILQQDSLHRIVQPFLEDTTCVASGGTIRVANGCEVKGGFLVRTDLPHNLLALFQIVEYLRAFLFGRLGWSPLNALLIISGAFGLFKKETVIEVGGYRTQTIGEDMELIVRMHRKLRLSGTPYKITFIPDPICWTEAPEDLKTLRNQRIRWQRGLAESLSSNLSLLFHPKGGAPGWLSFPFMAFFEWLGPVFEVIGYIFMVVGFLLGVIDFEAMFAFFLVTLGLGMLLSTSALLLDEISFRLYPKLRNTALLFGALVLENFGYRQLNSWWRMKGVYQWAFGKKGHWGEMKRRASWQSR